MKKHTYNTKAIMSRAWELRRATDCTMGEAMKIAWAEAKAAAGVTPMDDKIQAYFNAKRIFDAAKAALDAIAGEIQDVCLQSPNFTISGFGWNASFKEVTRQILDTKSLKADNPDLYAEYTHEQTSRRFLCKPVAVSV